MKTNKIMFAVFIVALLGFGLVSAYGSWKSTEKTEIIQPSFIGVNADYEERRAQMQELRYQFNEAIESGDSELIAELEGQITELRSSCPNKIKTSGCNGQGMYSGQGVGYKGNCPYVN